MGEARRRKQLLSNKSELTNVLRLAQEEGQNLWDVHIFLQEEVLSLLDDTEEGDSTGRKWLPPIAEIIGGIYSIHRPSKSAPLCALCDKVFWKHELPAAILFLSAKRDNPTTAFGSGVCLKCLDTHRRPEALRDAVLANYRDRLFGEGLRLLPPESEAGHA